MTRKDYIEFARVIHGERERLGYRSAASNTGHYSAASNTGYQSAASVSGKHSIAMASGLEGRAMAGPDGAIVLVNRDPNTGAIRHIRAAKVIVAAPILLAALEEAWTHLRQMAPGSAAERNAKAALNAAKGIK